MAVEEFLYISARLKSLEAKNLTREKYEKMIESKSVEDAASVLAECEYGDGVITEKITDFEKLFAEEQKKTYDLVEDICPEKNLVYFFRYQNDCHNLKSCIKSEIMNTDPTDLMSSLGTLAPDKALSSVRERNFELYPKNMAAAFSEAVESYSKNKDPMFIDIIMDKACFADMRAAADNSSCEFIHNLIKTKTDLVNIMTAVRIMRMKYTLDILRRAIISGGSLDEAFFSEHFDSTETKLFEALRYTDYYTLADLVSSGSELTLSKLEKACDELYAAKIKETRLISYGPETVIGYIASKETEIKNARIVISGKQADLPGDVIRERLRAVYGV